MKAIEIQSISKTFFEGKEISALKEISLEVERGELFGLIGPDGAGKTSLFRILTTLLLPTQGTAFVEGYSIQKQWKEIRKIVGYMPGKFSLYQDLSVEENLLFFARLFGTSIEENFDLIKDIYIQIEPFKNRKAAKLSGGMKQKLALSCALIHRPKVLFLDEPTTGVDPVSRREFWEMLAKLKKEGISIFVSTPYMDEAVLCDRIALIQEGSLLSINTPESIKARYIDHLYALTCPDHYAMLQTLRGKEWIEGCYLFGQSLHLTVKEKNEPLLATFIQQNAQAVIQQIQPSVEDCFIQLLGLKKAELSPM